MAAAAGLGGLMAWIPLVTTVVVGRLSAGKYVLERRICVLVVMMVVD